MLATLTVYQSPTINNWDDCNIDLYRSIQWITLFFLFIQYLEDMKEELTKKYEGKEIPKPQNW